MRPPALQQASLDGFPVAASRDYGHPDQFREPTLKPAANIQGSICRAILNDDDLLEHVGYVVRERLNKKSYVGLQVRSLVVSRNNDAKPHQSSSRTAARADSIESSMLV